MKKIILITIVAIFFSLTQKIFAQIYEVSKNEVLLQDGDVRYRIFIEKNIIMGIH